MQHQLSVPAVRLLALAVLALALGSGCSSSGPPEPPSDESPAPDSPSFSLLYTTPDENLVLHDGRRDTSRLLATGVTTSSGRAVSPRDQHVAFSYRTADSSRLALLNLRTHRVHRVHAVEGPATYSLAWHPDTDRLAYGYYRPAERGERGSGSVRIAASNGSSHNPGCSTVREVLAWLPSGSIAARTDDRVYLVSPQDCATQTSRDARRMYHTTYAPTGDRVAYIHRELKYDRSADAYVPDSSLVLSDVGGGNTETLFGNERHVRHLQWSPSGSELAFDVVPEEGGHRQVVIYDGDRPIFLVPPAQTTADQVHPRWSPSGRHVAFTSRIASGPQAAVRVEGQTRRLGRTTGPVWGWLDDRSIVVPGPDSIRVKTLSGTTRYTRAAPETLIHIWHRPVS